MLLLLATLTLRPAAAAETALPATEVYTQAASLMRAHYLWEERLTWPQMLAQAGDRLEEQIGWLLAESPSPDRLLLRDGAGRWRAEVALADPAQLPEALAQLEREVRGSGLPLGDLLLPAEILRGAVRVLDRHSAVLAGESLEKFDERIGGTLTGIGATIGPNEAGALVIKGLVRGGPAEGGGLLVGDRLLRIGGVSTVGMTSDGAIRRIRGAAGTEVVLTVERGVSPGQELQTLELRLVRREILLSNVEAAEGPEGIGVVTIDHFSEQTSHFLDLSLQDLGGRGLLAGGLIVDLRQNTGGSLLQSARAADTFVGQGMLVRTAGRGDKPVSGLVARIDARPDSPGYAMPMAVLMDHATASGSEILAGALALLDRAILIGEASFGKGTVQKTYPLNDRIKLKMTVAQYLLAGDRRVHGVGLAPDIAVRPVHFFDEDRQGEIWFPAEEVSRRNLPAQTPILPVVVLYGGTSPDASPAVSTVTDATAKIAARVLRSARGGSRTQLLDAAIQALPELQAEAERALVEAFAARGLSWQAGVSAPLGTAGGATIGLELRSGELPLGAIPAGEQTIGLHLQSRGGPLYRAAIRLRSTRSLWEDRVVPLGYVPQGGEATGRLRLLIPAGAERLDRVEFWLEVPGQAPLLLQSADLHLTGAVAAPIPAEIHYQAGEGTDPGAIVIAVEGRRDPIPDLVARVAFPDDPGLELLTESTQPVEVGRRAAELRLGLRVAADHAGPIRLEITLSSARLGLRQPMTLEIPADGTPILASPPVLAPGSLPLRAPPGSLPLALQLSDDGPLDHLTVLAGVETVDRSRYDAEHDYQGDKIAWLPADQLPKRRQPLALTLPVQPGPNRYTLIAEDAAGLQTVRQIYVLGAE